MDSPAQDSAEADSVPVADSAPKAAGEASPSFGLKKLLGLLVFAAVALPVVHFTPLGGALADMHSLRDRLDGTGIEYELKFFGLASVLIALGAPRLMFFALAGLLFGLVEGFFASMGASMAGSFATFLFIRWAGRDWVAARLGKNRFFSKITHIRPTALSVFLVRQLPVSGIFINATLALSTVRSRAFLIGSFLGFVPQGVVALLIGSGVSADFLHEGALQLVAAGAGLALFSFCIWRFKLKKTPDCAPPMTSSSLPIRFFERPLFWPVLLILLAAGTYWLRLDAPTDLEGYAQTRNIGYVLDAVHHDHWLTQRDLQGRILSKPPLHTWAAALSVKAFGLNRFALTVPSFVAVVSLALLVFHIGRRQFGLVAGGLAGLTVVMSPLYSKQIAMVRSDAIFAFFITAGMWAAWRAWREEKSWTAFWFVGALGTLTKGPLAVLLAGIGLVACLWEKRSSHAPVPLRGSHTLGLLAFFAVCFAWLIPALIEDGRELVDMIFYGELLGQATGINKDKIPFSSFPEPTLNLLSRFAPFSLLGFYGLWRVFRRPAADAGERAFERFLACAVLGGLLVFSCAAHFRSDLILPLWAPCALLAGREGARLLQRVGGVRFAWGLGAVAAGLAAFAFVTYHPASGPRSHVVEKSVRALAAADALRQTDIVPAHLVHIGTPTTFQMYLNTAHPWVEPAHVHALFTDEGPPRLLAIGAAAADNTLSEIGASTVRERFRWPANPDAPAVITIYELAW